MFKVPCKFTGALSVLLALASCGQPAPPAPPPEPVATAPAPIPVKAVVVTMFEIGSDEGDTAGEFQLWKERHNLTQVFEFGGSHDLYFDPASSMLVMVTGIGTANSAASVMMLGMDPRFDLTNEGVGLSRTGGQIDDLVEELEEVRADIVAGRIDVPRVTADEA